MNISTDKQRRTRATLATIQVGVPRTWGQVDAVDPLQRPWRSAIVKAPVEGPVFVGRLNLAGDAQADLEHHGGPEKAICVYALDHYELWERELSLDALGPAAFGENFTVQGLVETDVCIGDVWDVGTIAVQVSQPRQPCWKLARRWQRKDLALRVQQTGRTGWYFRVLREGTVQAGQTLSLSARPHPMWTVAAANAVMHDKATDAARTAALAALPELSASWRRTLTQRLGGHRANAEARLGVVPCT